MVKMTMEEPQFDYERRRFETSRRGRRTNRLERKIAQLVLAKLLSNKLIVDIPCGLGRFSDIIIQEGHRYVGMDLNFDHAHYSSKRREVNLPAVQASIFELPLASNSVDLIFSVRMFHHFEEDKVIQALKEISRVAPQSLITFYNRRTWRKLRKLWSWRLRQKRLTGQPIWREKTYSIQEIARLAKMAGLHIKEKIPSFGFFSTNQFLWLERDQC